VYSAEEFICKNGVGGNYIMRTFSMYSTHQAFLRPLIESGCNVWGMWQINELIILLYNLEGKRQTGRARRRGEVFNKIDLKENGWGK
jgi:hypothetical protein